jgi:methylenetetrahydrofolate dehydrogenase (NADP+)/methenyltetrahydrofolate cyclohydrolase
VVILVGEDPASSVYVRNKVAACEKAGFYSEKITYPADVAQEVVMAKIAELNADKKIHGILVQLPVPKHFDTEVVLEAIAPEKGCRRFPRRERRRVDAGPAALHSVHALRCHQVLRGSWRQSEGCKEAVVIGRSNIVGKPMAMLLLQAGATVTVCHSQTKDLAFHTRRADVLVAAVGRPKFVTADMSNPGAVVIDVGINRLPDGKLCGDVDFEGVKEVAGAITPVPGGVGPMTITMLLANTLEAAERSAKSTLSPRKPGPNPNSPSSVSSWDRIPTGRS